MNNAIIAGDPDIQRSIDAISAKKREAAAWFEQHGYPHQKLEDWKYTPVHRITAPDYVLPGRDTASLLSKESFATLPFTGLDAWYLVFINGWLSSELSVIPHEEKGITVGNMADEALQTLAAPHLGTIAGLNSGFVASNTAGFTDGRSEEHTSELQSLMRISYAVFCLKKKNKNYIPPDKTTQQKT